ncbi:SNARE-associated protein Snapin [Bagarius yarrelli]|uniref:Biogenesis of lysosome-related organelles complex 1 subunit 7 n=1 Tax=Bagarius yarrelli TaxID=175774 RepID=A0A556TP57_BAGYA|nr:SNARE-associated protein Snapin [Bagarius yarrelli]
MAALAVVETPSGRDAIAEGLMDLLKPAVQQLDLHVHAVRESQVELREHIDNLATELCRINEHQKVALDLDPYVKKLLNARRRVVLVNNILQNAQQAMTRSDSRNPQRDAGVDHQMAIVDYAQDGLMSCTEA